MSVPLLYLYVAECVVEGLLPSLCLANRQEMLRILCVRWIGPGPVF